MKPCTPSRMGGVNAAAVVSAFTLAGTVPMGGSAGAAAPAAPGAGVAAAGIAGPGAGAAGPGGAGASAWARASPATTINRTRSGQAGMNDQRDSAPAGLRIIKVFLQRHEPAGRARRGGVSLSRAAAE